MKFVLIILSICITLNYVTGFMPVPIQLPEQSYNYIKQPTIEHVRSGSKQPRLRQIENNNISSPKNADIISCKSYNLSIEDTTIILNSLHYYKKVENKKGNFKQYDTERINKLRDSIVEQMVHEEK